MIWTEEEFVKVQIENMLAQRVYSPTQTQYVTPIAFARKENVVLRF